MEPCGHLALCGGCHDAWARIHGTCVLCRTPGKGLHLLSLEPAAEAAADWGLSQGTCINVDDGALTLPANVETGCRFWPPEAE
eukprot:1887414-Prymnesium_polylepis.1